MADAWGANTFPTRKQLPDLLFLKFVDPLLVFLTFSSNKRWWWLCAFSFLGRRTRESHVALPYKGRLRKLVTPLGTVFRELSHLICVQLFVMTFSFICLPFFLLCSCIHVTLLMLFVFGVVVYLIHALINICSFDAHTTPTLFAHTVSY